MATQKCLQILWYLGLFVSALMIFVRPSIDNYLSAKTSYTLEQKPITLDDLPTVGVCFPTKEKLRYGEDFNISEKIHNQTVYLEENLWVPTTLDLQVQLIEMSLSLKTQRECSIIKHTPYRKDCFMQCYKISSKWNRKDETKVNMPKIVVQLVFQFPN